MRKKPKTGKADTAGARGESRTAATVAVRPKKKAPPGNPVEEKTRARLVRAALVVFAEKGFDAASTRLIAARAAVNLAAIPYYFGSKENLYRAAINSLVDFASARFLTARAHVEDTLAHRAPRPAQIRTLLEEYLAAFIATTAAEEISPFSPLFLREQLLPGGAFDILYQRVIDPAHETAARLIGRLLDLAPDSRACILRTHALFGQIFGFLTGRNIILRRLGQKAYRPQDVEEIQMIITENIRSLFPAAAKGRRHE